MIGEISTKEELLSIKDDIERKISELENQLTSIKEEVDFLIQQPKNQLTIIKQPKNIGELKIPENVKVISIPEIKQKIIDFLGNMVLLNLM